VRVFLFIDRPRPMWPKSRQLGFWSRPDASTEHGSLPCFASCLFQDGSRQEGGER